MTGPKLLSIGILAAATLFGTGADWWDGLEVDTARWDRIWHIASWDSYEEAVVDLAEQLSQLEIDEVLERCRLVIAAAIATEPERSGGVVRRIAPPHAVDFLLCGAAIHRMGVSGDERWLDVLGELSPTLREAAAGVYVNRMEPLPLGILTGRAYRQILHAESTPQEIVALWRESVIGNARERGIDTRGVGSAFLEMLRERPARPEFLQALSPLLTDSNVSVRRRMSREPRVPPELRDLQIAMLADPDPIVRRNIAAPLLNERRPLRDRAAPLLLRFLAREDIDDDEARDVALQALRIYGYELARDPEGRPMAVPLEPDLPPVTLPAEPVPQ